MRQNREFRDFGRMGIRGEHEMIGNQKKWADPTLSFTFVLIKTVFGEKMQLKI